MTTPIAMVTFLSEYPGMCGRRIVTLKKIKSKWLIVHLQASGIPVSR
jgi:hypothetical protein